MPFSRFTLTLVCSALVSGTTASLAQVKDAPSLSPTPQIKYTVVDCGTSLVRTLVNTPGLNSKADLAVWHVSGPNMMQGVVYHGNQMLNLVGERGYPLVYPADINDRLAVVGISRQNRTCVLLFEWNEGKLVILPGIGGRYAAATAINSRGDVAGNGQVASGARHAVLWQSQQATDLGLLEKGDYSSARDINDSGDVVGEANSDANGKPRAVLWHNGHIAELPGHASSSFCSAGDQ